MACVSSYPYIGVTVSIAVSLFSGERRLRSCVGEGMGKGLKLLGWEAEVEDLGFGMGGYDLGFVRRWGS